MNTGTQGAEGEALVQPEVGRCWTKDICCPPVNVPPCQLVTCPAQAERLRPQWEALLEGSHSKELTQSPDWLLAWWRVYGGWQGRQLRLGLFQEAGRLIGLAPLLSRRHWYRGTLPFRRLELLASGEPAEHGIYSNHLSILAEQGAEEEVASRLVQALGSGVFGGWDEVVLPMMAGDSPMPGLLVNGFRAAGIEAEMREVAHAPYIVLPTTWEEYLRSLGANSRRNIQRSLKAFDAWSGGTTRLESVTCLADLEKGKQILIQLHHARWASDSQTGVFHSPFYLQFHNALMTQLAEHGTLELHWLCARDEPIAVLYGIGWGDKIYAYQTGRRTDLPSHLRPGAVLLTLVIRRAIERGQREFDLLAEDRFYKRQLAPRARSLVRVRAARPCLLENLRQGAKTCQHFLARRGWFRGLE